MAHPFGSMTMRRISFAFLLALGGLACAKWTHPAKGEREFQSDRAICERAGEASGETEHWARYRVYRACMVERGWTPHDSWCCDRKTPSP